MLQHYLDGNPSKDKLAYFLKSREAVKPAPCGGAAFYQATSSTTQHYTHAVSRVRATGNSECSSSSSAYFHS